MWFKIFKISFFASNMSFLKLYEGIEDIENVNIFGRTKDLLRNTLLSSPYLKVHLFLLLTQGELFELTQGPMKATSPWYCCMLHRWLGSVSSSPLWGSLSPCSPYVLHVCEIISLIQHIDQHISSWKINLSQSVRNCLINVKVTCYLTHRFIKKAFLTSLEQMPQDILEGEQRAHLSLSQISSSPRPSGLKLDSTPQLA